MPKLLIDGKEMEFEAKLTLLQADEQTVARIPRFCYHERLSVAGNCRMAWSKWCARPDHRRPAHCTCWTFRQ